MSKNLGFDDIVGEEIIIEADSEDNLEEKLDAELDKRQGVPCIKSSFVEVCLYIGSSFESSNAYVFGRGNSVKEADKAIEQLFSLGGFALLYDKDIEQKPNNGKAEAEIVSHDQRYGIVGRGGSAKQNIHSINDNIQKVKRLEEAKKKGENVNYPYEVSFKYRKHIKATYRYSFVEVSEDKTIDEELKDNGIDKKWFDIFLNKEIRKRSFKSDEIMPVEQYRKIIKYFQEDKIKILDKNLKINKKALTVFEDRLFFGLVAGTDSQSSTIIKKDNVYVITNLTLYGLDGLPVRQYPVVELNASPVLGADDQPIRKNQSNWLNEYKNNDDEDLLSLPLFFAISEAIYDNKQDNIAKELLENLIPDLQKSWLVTSSRFNYSQDKVWHDYGVPEKQIEINQNISGISEYLENLVNQTKWEKSLKAIFMTKNIQKIPEVLGVYNRKPRLWVPERNREIERAAWVGFSYGNFDVNCYDILDDGGRSRGVRAKFSTGKPV